MQIEVSDIGRLRIGPDEALVVSFPPDMGETSVHRAVQAIRRLLDEHELRWPVLFTTDEVQFEVLSYAHLRIVEPEETDPES